MGRGEYGLKDQASYFFLLSQSANAYVINKAGRRCNSLPIKLRVACCMCTALLYNLYSISRRLHTIDLCKPLKRRDNQYIEESALFRR